ncbi:serine-rich adhesin for platelets isoform X3 [Topomyia yanbarensis]|uniref:serine-rich adhesin for platelets isoform X3 n=1 Tax=Topomyia yanbarensis TaxID=2498891 RepID=UPI00273B549E|nr:serine-rich adhesin for platelets isoform X3 [Topomyia yanbarensis]
MSPERQPTQDDGDGGGGGTSGGGTIIGGHVTVETSSPVPSPGSGQLDATSSVGSSMVLSSIPLEANQLILQQHLGHQQPHHIIATGNHANQSNSTSNGSAISAASSVGGNHSIIINNNTSFKNHNNIVISGSSSSSSSTINNHTYTINLSGSHNGHAVIANGGSNAIPIHSYAPVATTAASVNNSTNLCASNYSNSHHLGQQQFHHHHHQQQQQQPQLHPTSNSGSTLISSVGIATAHSNGSIATSAATVVAPTPPPPETSKLVVLQQGHLGENYITTDGMNGVGNIVLLATEQMDEHDILNNNVIITSSNNGGNSGSGSSSNSNSSSISSNSNGHGNYASNSHIISHHSHSSSSSSHHNHHHHPLRNGTTTVLASNGTVVNPDEELTSLTWLHDKNLLKGINLSKVPVSSPDSPRQSGSRLSPTSDFVEDSNKSEDNTYSAHPIADQSSGIYCTETLHSSGRSLQPGVNTNSETFYVGNGRYRTVTAINGDLIIEYPVITSEEKELKSPSSTVSCASSSSPPSSTSSLYNSSPSPCSNGNGATAPPAAHSGSNSGTSTPYQHFHKKYLREEHMKQLKQVSSSYVTPVKQQTSAIKYEEGELIDERQYPPAPTKNGYSMSVSPNVSSDDYSSTYGGSMKPPSSPPLSPQHMNGSGTMVGVHPQSQPSPQQPSSVSGGGGTNGSQHSQAKLSPPKAKHPTNMPYDPHVNVQSKPPFSFSSLIFMAIENCQQKALPVKEIYAWIVQHFPYFKTAPTGWKNSVRHNLSLNKCFQKVEKAANESLQNLGKGSLWMVEPQYRPNLIQALSRSPFHSGSGIDKTTYKAMQQQAQQQQQQQHQRSTDSPTSSVGSSYSKQDNFPYLASRLAPGDAQNGAHLHHLHSQQHQHADPDGDDFSRSSTPIDYEGGGSDLPHHATGPGGPYHVTYQHHGGPPPPTTTTTTVINGVTYAAGAPTAGMISTTGGESISRDWSADTIDDVNAATAMLALKHGPKIFTEGFQNGTPPVITTSPSEDHTYSAGGNIPAAGASGRSSQTNSDANSNGTLSDAAYESSEESQNLPMTDDLEEQRRQAGVDALLNLAGIVDYSSTVIQSTSSSLKRPASTPYDSGHQSPYQSGSQQSQQHLQLETTPPSGYSVVVHQQSSQVQPYRSYYMPDELSQYSSPSPPKKSKSSSARMLKKFKKKASWVR